MEKLRKEKVIEVSKDGNRDTHRLREEARVLLQLYRKVRKHVIRPQIFPGGSALATSEVERRVSWKHLKAEGSVELYLKILLYHHIFPFLQKRKELISLLKTLEGSSLET